MYTVQRLSLCDEAERCLVLADGWIATIGSDPATDMRLHSSFGLPPVCLKVWVDGHLCVGENVTGDPDLVRVNGQPTFGIVQLEDGDALQIGSDQFAVLLQRTTSTHEPELPRIRPVRIVDKPLPKESMPPDLPPSREFRQSIVNKCVTRHDPIDRRWQASDALLELFRSSGAILFANFRHAGLPWPRASVIGDDLFREMPDEVREIYSLHAVTAQPPERMLEIYEMLATRDAVVCGVPSGDGTKCLGVAKLYLAWLARPSVLEMALQGSPLEFCESLLRPFHAIVLNPRSDKSSWAIYSTASFDPAGLLPPTPGAA